jgi:hypothetical protein
LGFGVLTGGLLVGWGIGVILGVGVLFGVGTAVGLGFSLFGSEIFCVGEGVG